MTFMCLFISCLNFVVLFTRARCSCREQSRKSAASCPLLRGSPTHALTPPPAGSQQMRMLRHSDAGGRPAETQRQTETVANLATFLLD